MAIPQHKTAAHLLPGQSGVISGFTREDLSLKLLEMGLLPESEIALVRIAPLGDPLYFRVGEYHLSLRKEEAATVLLHA